jgi:hypothetical protein
MRCSGNGCTAAARIGPSCCCRCRRARLCGLAGPRGSVAARIPFRRFCRCRRRDAGRQRSVAADVEPGPDAGQRRRETASSASGRRSGYLSDCGVAGPARALGKAHPARSEAMSVVSVLIMGAAYWGGELLLREAAVAAASIRAFDRALRRRGGGARSRFVSDELRPLSR